jgi:predicted nuclease with TOPRIM domain
VTAQRHTVDTITDDELDRLYAERDELRQRFHNQAHAATELIEQLGTTEAELVTTRSAIDRVRKLHQRWDASPGDCAHCITGSSDLVPWPCLTIQALDNPEQ